MEGWKEEGRREGWEGTEGGGRESSSRMQAAERRHTSSPHSATTHITTSITQTHIQTSQSRGTQPCSTTFDNTHPPTVTVSSICVAMSVFRELGGAALVTRVSLQLECALTRTSKL